MQPTKWFLTILFFCAACSNNSEAPKPDIKFDRFKWNTKSAPGINYTYRPQMVNDLLNSYTWPGLKKDSVIKLLDEPDEIEENIFILYHYAQSRLGMFPISTQSLVFQLAPDSTVVLARDN